MTLASIFHRAGMLRDRVEAGPIQPLAAHYVAALIGTNHKDLQNLGSTDNRARVRGLVEDQHVAQNARPADPDVLAAWTDALDEKLKNVGHALDPKNLDRVRGAEGMVPSSLRCRSSTALMPRRARRCGRSQLTETGFSWHGWEGTTSGRSHSEERRIHVDYALEPDNPHRGNGFGGEGGHYNPEPQILGRTPLPAGAEVWKIAPDGNRTLVARMNSLNRWEIAS